MNRMLCKNPFTILLDQLKYKGQRQHAGIETFRILGAQPLNQYDAVRCVIIGLSGISEFCIGSTFAGAVVGKAEAVKIADKVFTGSSIENPFLSAVRRRNRAQIGTFVGSFKSQLLSDLPVEHICGTKDGIFRAF